MSVFFSFFFLSKLKSGTANAVLVVAVPMTLVVNLMILGIPRGSKIRRRHLSQEGCFSLVSAKT